MFSPGPLSETNNFYLTSFTYEDILHVKFEETLA
jgi:hypothetical protein